MYELREKIDAYMSKYKPVEPAHIELWNGAINTRAKSIAEARPKSSQVQRLSPDRLDSAKYILPGVGEKKQVIPSLANPISADKDKLIFELRDTIQTMSVKISKLESLLSLKDRKIEEFAEIMRRNGIA